MFNTDVVLFAPNIAPIWVAAVGSNPQIQRVDWPHVGRLCPKKEATSQTFTIARSTSCSSPESPLPPIIY